MWVFEMSSLCKTTTHKKGSSVLHMESIEHKIHRAPYLFIALGAGEAAAAGLGAMWPVW